ncbi:MaoC family dehydratase [Anaerovorax sp. IOR16]|uniref:MaoC family dehydratase n=1 Tax=Anaerovorax sp. IOR16 TaxID=2773458 RepID=UPI0019D21BE4|nr:MaoC family dehydratase [Anaerovorax sp. IOR16]
MKSLQVGDSISKKFIATELIVSEIAKVSGDINPIHLDEDYAANTIFGKRIAHGLFCINAVFMIIGNYFPGIGSILLSQNFNYRRPIYLDDEIEVKLVIKEIIEEKDLYLIEIICTNQEGKLVLSGDSTVKWRA